MTDAEKDAVWRSLPEPYRKWVEFLYTKIAKYNCNDAYKTGASNTYEKLFGKHNLTASEEKPRFNEGDEVLVSKYYDFGGNCNAIFRVLCIKPHYIIGFINDKAMLRHGDFPSGCVALVPQKYLIPYTEEQEPKEGNINNEAERIMLESLKISASARLAEKNIKWHVYRMELAKELAVAALSRKGCIDINELMDDVDGIVERLKGGEK